MKHIIELTYTDNSQEITGITGTDQEIYTFYRENNFFAWCSENKRQIKRIEFVMSALLDNKSELIYLFIDYDNNGLLQ